MSERIHFIAIGGAAMHNLAIALHKKGFIISGSDDEINEPSRSNLERYGLLPALTGWFPEKLSAKMNAVILGMHARADNPELLKARQLGIRIYSYPEYLYEFSKNKKRVVIGGSHGKTTITAMIMHVLKEVNADFDYMVGSKLDGFDTMVKLTESAPVIILEGDEYLASPVDRRPKIHLYRADIALISGIAWDHINVFPTFDNYVEQFRIFANQVPSNGALIYCEEEEEVRKVMATSTSLCKKIPYGIPEHKISDGVTYIYPEGNSSASIQLKIFGLHNLLNLEGARKVCHELGVSNQDFYKAVSSFRGASRRLEFLAGNGTAAVFKDFAHSPSKVKATAEAVKHQFPDRKLVACLELHTFSSLNKNFLSGYHGSLEGADEAIVYFNPHTIEHKKLEPVTEAEVRTAFGKNDLTIFTDSRQLYQYLSRSGLQKAVVLMMSSGNFDGLNLEQLAREIAGNTVTEA